MTTTASTVDVAKHQQKGGQVPRPQKPDQEKFKAQVADVEKEMEQIRADLNTVRETLSKQSNENSTGGGENDERSQLRQRMQQLREQLQVAKSAKNDLFDGLKRYQESMKKKNNDLKLMRAKCPFKTVEEMELHIKKMEAQVESGQLKLIDEKRLINEISTLKRNRKVIDGLNDIQKSIDADKHHIDQLRKKLDDEGVENKKVSEELDTLQAKYEKLNKEKDADWSKRKELQQQRNDLQKRLDAAFAKKRELQAEFRRANDLFYQFQQEERQRRIERERSRKEQEIFEKQRDQALLELEQASIPIFMDQINQCEVVHNVLKAQFTSDSSSALPVTVTATSVTNSNRRVVEALPEKAVVISKKGGKQEEDVFFVGKKSKKSASSSGLGGGAGGKSGVEKSTKFNLPLSVIEILSELKVDLPLVKSDVPKCLEAIQAKKAWFEENQDEKTRENKKKAEEKLAKIMGKSSSAVADVAAAEVAADLASTDAAGAAEVDVVEEEVTTTTTTAATIIANDN